MKSGQDSLLDETSVSTPSRGPGKNFPSTARVLVALSNEEYQGFFSQRARSKIGEIESRFADTSGMSEDGWADLLDEFLPTVLVTCWSTPRLPEFHASNPDSPLKYICHVTGSTRAIVPRSFIERGGIVTNWGGLISDQVAEHALLLALAALRNLPAWRPFIHADGAKSCWHPIPQLGTRSLFRSRVGLHGFGRIALALVRLLQPFNVAIRAFSEGVPAAAMQKVGVTPCESVASLFSESDVLFECESLTAKSAGSVDAPALASLPEGAVFVNVGRGAVVNEQALIAEAKTGRIRIAIDVVTNEPLASDSELFSIGTATISPHVAAPTADQFHQCGDHALQNVSRYLSKEPMEDVVTLAVYDRST